MRLKNIPLLTQALIGLAIMVVVLIAGSVLVISSNQRQIHFIDVILQEELPDTINTLQMIDELNDIYLSLYSYVNGETSAKADYYKNAVEYQNFRHKIIIDGDQEKAWSNGTNITLENQNLHDHLRFIDGYFETFLEDVEAHIFLNYDPGIEKIQKQRANFLQMEIKTYIQDPLENMKDSFEDPEKYLLLEETAMDLYHSLMTDEVTVTHLARENMNNAEMAHEGHFASGNAESFFRNLQALKTMSTSICLNKFTLDCDHFTRKINELRNLGEVYFESNFNTSKAEALNRVLKYEVDYVQPLQQALEEFSELTIELTKQDIERLNGISQFMQIVIYVAVTATFIFLIFIFVLIWNKMLKPLATVSSSLDAMCEGNFDIDIEIPKSRNEVGLIFRRLAELKSSLVELEKLRKLQMRKVKDKHNIEMKKAYDALKISENNLRHYSEQLEATNQDLEQFIHVASHDLREPLKNIVGVSQMIKLGAGKADFPLETRVAQIQANVERMNVLIDDLRVLSKLQNSDEAYQICNLNTILATAIENNQGSFDMRQATLKIGTLPEIMGLERYLRIVFDQLLSNALHYGGKSLIIQIEPRESLDEDFELIAFSNNLDEALEKSSKLFLPFARGQNADRNSSGVGLSVCRKIVEDVHKGKIRLDEADLDNFTVLISFPKIPEGKSE